MATQGVAQSVPQRFAALAERCEQAAGPDQALDAQIYDAVYGGDCTYDQKWEEWITPGGLNVKRYTASLDAAMTLVPEGHWYCIGREDSGPWARCYDAAAIFEAPEEYGDPIDAATAALALCAAALKAHAASADTLPKGQDRETGLGAEQG